MGEYKYQHLNGERGLRLLKIKPASKVEDLVCSLIHTTLKDETPYYALSYTWGSNVRNKAISCDGMTLYVTENLRKALYRVRQSDRERIIWIDGVCIDQGNVSERNAQVMLMKDIYLTAKEVLIWLGEECESDEAAFAILQKINEILDEDEGFDLMTDMLSVTDRGLPLPWSPEWVSISQLLSRQWFQRVWVIQEAVVASKATVLCGDLEMDWLRFNRALKSLALQPMGVVLSRAMNSPGFQCLSAMRNFTKQPTVEEKLPLLMALFMTRKFKATLAQDKIFALLSLLDNKPDVNVTVDYASEPAEVYYDFASKCIESSDCLDVLSFCGQSLEGSTLDLPTWVPDWSHDIAVHTPLIFSNAFSTSADNPLSLPFWNDYGKNILCVLGWVIDTVERKGIREARKGIQSPDLVSEIDNVISSDHEWLLECEAIAAGSPDPYFLGQPRSEAYWRTLICNMNLDLETAPVELGESYEAFKEMLALNQRVGSTDEIISTLIGDMNLNVEAVSTALGEGSEAIKEMLALNQTVGSAGEMANAPYPSADLLSTVPEFQQLESSAQEFMSCLDVVRGRSFCLTTRRYMGWIPQAAQPNDKIAIFGGGRVPFVIRPVGNGEYQLVGECYIHGVMEGEALSGDGFEDVTLEEIKIR
jgi:hypothetical protein